MSNKLSITLKRSMIGYPEVQRVTLKSLGLRKINQNVVRPDNASVRGMVNRISHLVEVIEVSE